jgi:uncharacterized protein YifE (UPF0438 family)
MDKNKREFLQMLRGEGLTLLSLERKGKHWRAVIEAANKKRMVYILSNSASDHRAAANGKSDIKRFFNN